MEILLVLGLFAWIFGGNKKDNDDYEKRRRDDFWGRCWDEDHNG